MKPLHLCIPVLNRYDLLRGLLLSLRESTTPVDMLCIVNNGRDDAKLNDALLDTLSVRVLDVHTPPEPLGLAESWNWMIRRTKDERLIANDDLEFASDSLQRLTETPGDLVSAAGVSMCSCFILRDSCVEKVGLFDELISPGYAYFEDNDYAERMFDAGAVRGNVEAGIRHIGSQTIAKFTDEEWLRHNKLFNIAEQNFLKKWGFHPRDHRPEGYVRPFDPARPLGVGV